MRIDERFLQAQSVFQDKTIQPLSTRWESDALGGTYPHPGEPRLPPCPANAQTLANEQLAQAYGLTIGRDVVLTGQLHELTPGSFFALENTAYRVASAQAYDSHVRVLGRMVQRQY